MSGTGTALVHPSTAKLPPDAQAKGVYHYTSPEELAARNAAPSALADENMQSLDVGTSKPKAARKPKPVATPIGNVKGAIATLFDSIYSDKEKEKFAVDVLKDLGWEIDL
ncbi:hypothetical protein [Vibrio phage vB_VpaP_G1]|uniref:Uncharacterized protein n=1 Tax=Vibrio phage vB_VpaP_G1 TaxID=2862773 RepID=A0AAE7WVA5_9CAUD|nr:hypothetical protein PP280_gp06 [Vibrio phage vB_VpaP_G1]QYW05806.1 hypothetical protein [Vibrio phage vB_VpaP_G1]